MRESDDRYGFRSQLNSQSLGNGEDILIAAPRQIDDDDVVFRPVRRDFGKMRERMRGFKRRDDPFQPAAELERVERLLVRGVDIFHPPDIMQPGMLRP